MAELGQPVTGARRRGIVSYALAVLVFGLLAWSGANALHENAPALGVPFLIAGLAGAVGAVVVAAAVYWRPRTRVQQAARLAMAAAAVAVAGTGVALAPADAERGFVIVVAAFVAALLAAFALVAGPPRR